MRCLVVLMGGPKCFTASRFDVALRVRDERVSKCSGDVFEAGFKVADRAVRGALQLDFVCESHGWSAGVAIFV